MNRSRVEDALRRCGHVRSSRTREEWWATQKIAKENLGLQKSAETIRNLRIALMAPATLKRAKHEPTPSMAEIKRSTLFGKLNSLGYKSIEGATIFCKLRGNPYVETAHWLHQLLQSQDSDVHRIIK